MVACVLRPRAYRWSGFRRVAGLGSEPGGLLGTEEPGWVGFRWQVESSGTSLLDVDAGCCTHMQGECMICQTA